MKDLIEFFKGLCLAGALLVLAIVIVYSPVVVLLLIYGKG